MSATDDKENMSSNLLAAIEDTQKQLAVSLDGISKKELDEYVVKQLKENYVKPRRTSGRKSDREEKYTIPMGIFNLGNNSVYYKEVDEKDEELLDDDVETHNYVKMVDGKLVVTEEEQKENAEEELLKYNLAAKNDLPYQIYHKILAFGRLTIEELYGMYKAIEKPMFLIVVNQMVSKHYLRKVRETDRDIVFHDPDKNRSTHFSDAYSVEEKEVETLEVVGENERRLVLEEKKS